MALPLLFKGCRYDDCPTVHRFAGDSEQYFYFTVQMTVKVANDIDGQSAIQCTKCLYVTMAHATYDATLVE